MSTPSILTRLKSKWQRIARNRRSMAELAACRQVSSIDLHRTSELATWISIADLHPSRTQRTHAATSRATRTRCGICKACLDGNLPRHGKECAAAARILPAMRA